MRKLLLLLLLCLPARAQTEFVKQAMQRYGVPGACVAVIQDGQVVYLQGFGPGIDPDTIFPLASVTKSFTAALCGVEVDAGKLGWDTPLNQIIPELRLSEDYATLHVTLRDVLAHQSGLPAFTGDLFDRLGYSHEEVIRRLVHMPLSAGFRDHAAYSNVGFFPAGMASARAAGTEWEDLMRRSLLTPLGLTRTGFLEHVRGAQNVAVPHMSLQKPMADFDVQTVLRPAGVMTSSGRDMARFVQCLLNGGEGVLKPETVAEMMRPVKATDPEFSDMAPIGPNSGFAFSMGFDNYCYNDYMVVEKAGARAGVRTIITMIPEKKLGIVVLCNLSLTAFPEAVRAHVLETYLGKSRLDLQAELWKGQEKVNQMFGAITGELPARPRPSAPSPIPLSGYVGVYENPLYGSMRLTLKNGELNWALGKSGYGAFLWPTGYTSFLLVEPAGGLTLPSDATFTLDDQGKPTRLDVDGLGTFTPRSGR